MPLRQLPRSRNERPSFPRKPTSSLFPKRAKNPRKRANIDVVVPSAVQTRPPKLAARRPFKDRRRRSSARTNALSSSQTQDGRPFLPDEARRLRYPRRYPTDARGTYAGPFLPRLGTSAAHAIAFGSHLGIQIPRANRAENKAVRAPLRRRERTLPEVPPAALHSLPHFTASTATVAARSRFKS